MKFAATTLRLVAAAALVCVQTLPAAAFDSTGSADAYWQHTYKGPAGSVPQAKFEEYHPMPNGFVFEHFDVEFDTANYELRIKGKNINQQDQEFQAEGGKPGSFMWSAEWNQTPHNIAYDTRSIYKLNGAYLQMTPAVRGTGVVNAAYINGMGAALSNAPYVPLGIYQEDAKLGLTFTPAKDWVVTFAGDRTHRYGTKSMAALFGFSDVVELPQPVDHLIHAFSADVGYNKKDYQFNVHYDISSFHNNFNSLMFDNPQQQVGTAAIPALGRMALEPDNVAHSMALEFGVDLPAKTHFSAEGGLSLWLQNAALDDATANQAAFAAAGAVGQTRYFNTADRRIAVYTQAYRLSNSYFDNFRTSLAFRSYAMENRSPVYTFPGYYVYDHTFTAGNISTPRTGYVTQDLDWKGDYDVTKIIGVAAGYTYETHKEDREIPLNYEQRFNLGTTIRPSTHFFTNLSYLLGLRRMKAYDFTNAADPGGTASWAEAPGLIRFDVGDRNRNQARLQMQYNQDDASAGLSYRYTKDDYRPGKVPLDGSELAILGSFTQYGLLYQDVQAAGLNFDVPLAKDFDLSAYAEYDYSKMAIQSNVANPLQDLGTNWQELYRTASTVGGVAVNYKPRRDLKVAATYDLVSTVGHLDFAADAQGVKYNGTDLGLVSLPPQTSLTQVLGLKTHYELTKALGLSARYQFWKYNVNDYASANTPLIIPTGTGIFLGMQHNNAYAHTFGMGADYKF